MDNDTSGTNTILIVLVLLIIVAVVVWLYVGRNKDAMQDDGIQVQVGIPSGSNSGSNNS